MFQRTFARKVLKEVSIRIGLTVQPSVTMLNCDLSWQSPSQMSGDCKCKLGVRKHPDLTQVIWPARLPNFSPRISIEEALGWNACCI